VLFDCLNTTDRKQIDATCDVLRYLLEFLDPVHVLNRYRLLGKRFPDRFAGFVPGNLPGSFAKNTSRLDTVRLFFNVSIIITDTGARYLCLLYPCTGTAVVVLKDNGTEDPIIAVMIHRRFFFKMTTGLFVRLRKFVKNEISDYRFCIDSRTTNICIPGSLCRKSLGLLRKNSLRI
jgi:hypothetical protein